MRGADIQTSATGGDVADQTSIQNRRVSTVTESLPVEDTTEQFLADEEGELGDDPLHWRGSSYAHLRSGTLVPGGLDRRPLGWNFWLTQGHQ